MLPPLSPLSGPLPHSLPPSKPSLKKPALSDLGGVLRAIEPITEAVDKGAFETAVSRSDCHYTEDELDAECEKIALGAFETLKVKLTKKYEDDPATFKAFVAGYLKKRYIHFYLSHQSYSLQAALKKAFFSHFREEADKIFLTLRKDAIRQVLALPLGLSRSEAEAKCMALAQEVVDQLKGKLAVAPISKETPAYVKEGYLRDAADHKRPKFESWKVGEGLGGYFFGIYATRPASFYIEELLGEPSA